MSDDSLIDNTEQDKRKKMARIVGGILVALQILLLLTYRSYLDFGHLIISILYIVVSLVSYWSLLRARILPAILSVVVASGLLYFSLTKVQWNERYLHNLTTSQAFIFEDYIDSYPTLEQHLLARTLGRQDWIRFADDCIKPALERRPMGGQCRTPEQIERTYNINVDQELNRFVRRMQRTAQDIEGGRIKSGGQYQKCLAEKICAPIALLPEEADVEKLQGDTSQYVEIRQAFWDLVEEKGLTPPICLTMTLCRGLLGTGVVSFGAPEGAPDLPSELEE